MTEDVPVSPQPVPPSQEASAPSPTVGKLVDAALALPLEQQRALLAALETALGAEVRKKREKPALAGSKTKEALSLNQQRELLRRAALFYRDPLTGHRRMDRPGSTIRDLHGPELRRLLYLMMHAGLHRDVVVNPIKRNLRCEDGALTWRRIKKTGGNAMCLVPLPDDKSRDWGPGFVVWLRARDGIHGKLLDRILEVLGREVGYHLRLTSYALRHTTGCNLASRGFPSAQIAGLMNCSIPVAERYCRLSRSRVEEEMRARGALVGPGVEAEVRRPVAEPHPL